MRQLWERVRQATRVTWEGTTVFGTRASAEGRPVLRWRESMRGSVQRKDLTPFIYADPVHDPFTGDIEVSTCRKCGGPTHVKAFILDPFQIKKIMGVFHLEPRPPPGRNTHFHVAQAIAV